MCLNPLENMVQTTSFQWVMASSGFFLWSDPLEIGAVFRQVSSCFQKNLADPVPCFFFQRMYQFLRSKSHPVLALNSYRWDEITPATSWWYIYIYHEISQSWLYMGINVVFLPFFWASFTNLSGWWFQYPSEKSWSSSVGMMKFPTFYGKSNQIPWFQSPPISITTITAKKIWPKLPGIQGHFATSPLPLPPLRRNPRLAPHDPSRMALDQHQGLTQLQVLRLLRRSFNAGAPVKTGPPFGGAKTSCWFI